MTSEQLKAGADTAWTLLTGFLVFWMNAGFGLVEAGLCRKKNATMILSKNFVVFAIATLGFYSIGFGLMFSDGSLFGSAGGWLLGGADAMVLSARSDPLFVGSRRPASVQGCCCHRRPTNRAPDRGRREHLHRKLSPPSFRVHGGPIDCAARSPAPPGARASSFSTVLPLPVPWPSSQRTSSRWGGASRFQPVTVA